MRENLYGDVAGPGWLSGAAEGDRQVQEPIDSSSGDAELLHDRHASVGPFADVVVPTSKRALRAQILAASEKPTAPFGLDGRIRGGAAASPAGVEHQFEALREISSNSEITVYEGFDRKLQRPVAIRALNPRHHADDSKRSLFWQEACHQARVQHPHLVSIHATIESRHWIVTELSDHTLADELAAGPLNVDRVEKIFVNTLFALAALHAQGLVHAAVRPSNLLVDKSGNVKLSRSAGPDAAGELDTPQRPGKYLAPEFVLPGAFGPIGFATDLYCLAFTTLELLAGRRFDGYFKGIESAGESVDEAWARWHASPSERLPDAEVLFPSLSSGVAEAINSMLVKQVSDRSANAEEIARAIESRDARLPAVTRRFGGGAQATTIVSSRREASVPHELGPARGNRINIGNSGSAAGGAGEGRMSRRTQVLAGIQCAMIAVCLTLLVRSASDAKSGPDLAASLPPSHGFKDPVIPPIKPVKIDGTKPVPHTPLEKASVDQVPEADPPVAVVPPPPEPPRRITISADPAGARLMVDGAPVLGASPFSIELSVGRHRVQLTHPAFYDLDQSIVVRNDDSIALRLSPRPGPPPFSPQMPADASRVSMLCDAIQTMLNSPEAKRMKRLARKSDIETFEAFAAGLQPPDSPDVRIWHAVGLVLAEAELYDRAMVYLDRASEGAPSHYLLAEKRAICCEAAQGCDDAAIVRCRRLLEKTLEASTEFRHQALGEEAASIEADSIHFAARLIVTLESVSRHQESLCYLEAQCIAPLPSRLLNAYQDQKLVVKSRHALAARSGDAQPGGARWLRSLNSLGRLERELLLRSFGSPSEPPAGHPEATFDDAGRGVAATAMR